MPAGVPDTPRYSWVKTLWAAGDKPIWGVYLGVYLGWYWATGCYMLQQPYAGTATASCSTSQGGAYPGISGGGLLPPEIPLIWPFWRLTGQGLGVAPGGSGQNTPCFDPI